MRVRCRLPLFIAVFIASVMALSASIAPSQRSAPNIPPAFERNVGQVQFDGGGSAAYVDAVIRMNGAMAYVHGGGLHIMQTAVTKDPASPKHEPEFDINTYRVDMQLIASNPAPRLEFQQKTDGIVRYILPGTGATGLISERFTALLYHDVWPGIDLRMYVTDLGVKYDFIVHPGADARQIAFRYVGGSGPYLSDKGDISVTTPLGMIGENAPVVFEKGLDGSRGNTVQAKFAVDGHSVRFEIGEYDRSRELVVDPQRVWGTYYGWNQNIETPRITADPFGNVFICGTTTATNMPNVAGVLQRRYKAGFDGFVAKFTELGKFVWHTYYGGSNNDRLRDVTTDAKGNVWTCGQTNSPDLPNLQMGSGPYGDWDSVQAAEVIVLKLLPNGSWGDSWQVYGRESDVATGIAVSADRVAIVGYTRSPRLGNLFGDAGYVKNPTNNSNNTDMFVSVVKPKTLNPDQWNNHYLIFYGGGGEDFGDKIGFDPTGNIIFGGITYSADFPVTDATTYKNYEDIAVVKFGPTPARQWATMFGTVSYDQFGDLAVDGTGAATVVGIVQAAGFPTTNPLQATMRGLSDGFIRKILSNGTTQFSTYYGGDSLDALYGVAVDKSNNVWIAGFTNRSTTIPISPDAFQPTPNGNYGYDGYFAQLDPTGQTVLYGTYYGAPPQTPLPTISMGGPPPPPNSDFGMDILNDIFCEGNAYVSMMGSVNSYRMDTTAGAYQDSSKLDKDTLRANGFVSYFSNCPDSIVTIVANGPETLCDVETRQLVAPNGFNKYLWSNGVTTRTIVVSDSGTYSVVCTTLDGCRYRDTIIIRRNPKPVVNAGGDVVSCLNIPVTLTATPSVGTPPYRYKWNRVEPGPEFIDSDTLQSPSVSPGTTSRYEVTVTDAAGCIGKDTVLVSIMAPKPNTSPALVDFGTLDACATAAEQEIIIANPMDYDIRISTFTPDNANVSLVTSLVPPIQIPAGELTRLRVRIAPTAAGTINGTFTLSGTPCAWSVSFPYKAVKQQLTATVIPGTISFGAGVICQQTSKTDSTTIRNGGQEVLVLQAGIVSAPFVLVSPTTSVSINPGEEKKVVFQYSPSGAGTFTTVAKFPFTSGSCSDTLRVNLNAITSEVTVTATPSSIDMGTLSGCEIERDTTITINNTSSVGVTVSLPSTAEVIFSPAGPLTIAARSTQNVRVTIRPAATGAFSQTATLVAEPCTVSLPVTFTAQKNGIAFTTPASVDFGEFSACEASASTTRTTQVTFDGTGSATVASVTTGSTLTTTLAVGQGLTPGQPVSFNVVWTPIAEGPLVDSIVVIFEPCSERRVIRVNGSRTRAELTSDNTNVALGSVAGTTTGTVTFTNSGTDTLRVGVTSRSANTFIVATRPANLTDILPGGRIEVDYRVNCAGRASFVDSIEAAVLSPCSSSAFTTFTGTCTTSTVAAQSHIVIDTAAVKIGDRFSVPIRIATSQGLNANNLRAWTANVTYNPMVVVGAGGSTPDCFVNGQFTPCTIAINGTRGTDTVGQIGELTFTAVLGTTDMTMLTLSNFVWTADTTADITTTDGKVVITDICREGGDRYLAPKLEGFSITVFPTPASTDLTILVKGAGTAPIPWSLANYIGVEVLNGTITPDASGTGQAVVDVRSLGAGLYLLTTDARGTTYRNTVLIQR
ncbi:MAG: SBBP repeat-containing protein [Ignavibacteria bacterium]|nr:SBBP repeat-containing protein [Ignavibacteria bacterium]